MAFQHDGREDVPLGGGIDTQALDAVVMARTAARAVMGIAAERVDDRQAVSILCHHHLPCFEAADLASLLCLERFCMSVMFDRLHRGRHCGLQRPRHSPKVVAGVLYSNNKLASLIISQVFCD
jgi:hypothetical protein